MGLFKKRSTDPEELERLKAEIAAMSDRLNASDEAKQHLEGKVQGIASRLETPIAPPPTKPPPAAPAIDTAEIDKLRAKFDRLSHRIDEVDATKVVDPDAADEEAARIERLQASYDELTRRLDDDSAAASLGHEAVERLGATMSRLSSRLDDLDGRITSISTELANQITELGADADAHNGAVQPVATELVDELRDAQERLASEQARYQIAFRQDLAELADRLKRA